MQFNTLSSFIFLCGVLLISLAAYAWQRRKTNSAVEFAVFMLFLGFYVLGYSMELASLDLAIMLFWNKVQYIGIYFFPPLFLVFILRYTGKDPWITRRNLILLFILPALLLAAKLTDSHFHWIYSTVTIDRTGPIPLLAFTRGPLYLFGAILNAAWVVAGLVVLWNKRSYSSALYRSQMNQITLSALWPLLVYLIYISGILPFPALKNLDLNCFAYIVTAAGVSWTMFRYRLFDLAPIAREALIENLNDGLIVVDTQFRVVDTNPAAVRLFDWHHPPIGQPVDQRIKGWLETIDERETPQAAPIEVQFEPAGKERFFEVDVSTVADRHGQCIGHLILLHDITERKRVEQELHELSLTDELTGLNNRRGFTMLANQYLQMAQRMDLPAVLGYIDLDDLKWVNDNFGHPAGDQALIDTATILKDTFRSADILARIGGDEFVVLSLISASQSGEQMLTRLQDELTAFNGRSDRRFALSLSMGIARSEPEATASLNALLEAADRSMYAQKQAKKSLQKTPA